MDKALTRVTETFTAEIKNLRRQTKSSVGVVVAISIVPMLVSVGMAIDMSHGVATRAALLAVADDAAMAGANAFTDSTQGATAQSVATAYVTGYVQKSGMTLTSYQVTPYAQNSPGSPSPNFNSVSVSMSATVPTLLLGVIGSKGVNITSKSVAGISPTLLPQTICAPSTGCPSQLTASAVKSTAADFNSVYLYGVPKDGTGKYNFYLYPAVSGLWEVGSNCNGYVDSNWTSASRCNSMYGATVSPSQSKVFSLPPDQPIAMMFVNQNNGQAPSNSNGYGANQYGLQPGQIALMFTALLSQATPASPSSVSDSTAQILQNAFGYTIQSQNTHYNTTYTTQKTATLSNCSVQIVQVLDPTNPPTKPPYPGQCLAPNDPKSGYQYANLSCNQIAGRTFMYWWNDMGANPDDYDYGNLGYMLTCQPGVTSTDGGTIASANPVVHKVAGLLK